MSDKLKKIEFGDFQTPDNLARAICIKLVEWGISPNIIIEPTCGIGAFVLAAAHTFPLVNEIHGFEVNALYLEKLHHRLAAIQNTEKIKLTQADFFNTNWKEIINGFSGSILILGNFPWVTNTAQSIINGNNLPEKSNFLNYSGFDAISGKANFDISEWMLLEILRCFNGRSADIAMLLKTSVARKVLAYAERNKLAIVDAKIFSIDAKKEFNAAVDACLLVIRLSEKSTNAVYDYSIYEKLSATCGRKVGYRNGLTVGDLIAFEASAFLLGKCPQKWRSGVKHDAAAIMELTRTSDGLMKNGLGELVDIEMNYLYPLLKGSDIGSGKQWREKFVIITQHFVGESTDKIRNSPKTWRYLESHAAILNARASSIYKKNPRFSIFGIGDYAFRPWRIAICGFYKTLRFRLISPIEDKSVMFDDTIYYLSFDSEQEANEVFELLLSESTLKLLSSLIFWDEKRPIKTAILNSVDWSKLRKNTIQSQQFELFPI
ncbi:MAG: hypothetical protein NTW85_07935 [Methylococcales bacterium]|nr:hypothetical protein [Methylococcales bacterium]